MSTASSTVSLGEFPFDSTSGDVVGHGLTAEQRSGGCLEVDQFGVLALFRQQRVEIHRPSTGSGAIRSAPDVMRTGRGYSLVPDRGPAWQRFLRKLRRTGFLDGFVLAGFVLGDVLFAEILRDEIRDGGLLSRGFLDDDFLDDGFLDKVRRDAVVLSEVSLHRDFLDSDFLDGGFLGGGFLDGSVINLLGGGFGIALLEDHRGGRLLGFGMDHHRRSGRRRFRIGNRLFDRRDFGDRTLRLQGLRRQTLRPQAHRPQALRPQAHPG